MYFWKVHYVYDLWEYKTRYIFCVYWKHDDGEDEDNLQ